MITADVAEAHRLSDRCPVCGKEKRIGHGFCSGCTNVLPSHMKAALNSKGARFAEAFEQAGRCITQRRESYRDVCKGGPRFAHIDYKRA